MNLAIIIGVSDYEYCTKLGACSNDVNIMKNVLDKLDKFDDICLIENSPKAYEAKQKITEFVNKHKEEEVDELVFYFSGHGARYEDDFFYVFSDFTEKRKEVSGLRNTELDGLIRNLSPKLTVKVVDACFSGSTYVKSDTELRPILEKSAKQNKLAKLYFLHSSSSEEESLATNKYSLFSKSFFASLTQNIGNIRHRDIMAYVADEMLSDGLPKPTFIVQADNTEIFGEVNQELIEYLNETLELTITSSSEKSEEQSNQEPNQNNFLMLVKEKSNDEYCNQETAFANLNILKDSFESDRWPSDIINVFDIDIKLIEYSIPNENEIGRWITKQSEKYFVSPLYSTEKYTKKEYIAVPKRPKSKNALGLYQSLVLDRFLNSFEDDVEYELEDVEKEHQVLSGIEFTGSSPYKAFQICFKPKFEALNHYILTIVPVFSRNKLAVFNTVESLHFDDWDHTSSPTCRDWKIDSVGLKQNVKIISMAASKISSVSSFIVNDVQSKME